MNVTATLASSGGVSGKHWGLIPDMTSPVTVTIDGESRWLITMYLNDPQCTSPVGYCYSLIAMTSDLKGESWTPLSVIKNNTGIDGTQTGPCSTPSEVTHHC